MRKLLFLTGMLFSLTVSISPQDKGLGVGVIVGEPTGISVKYWLNDTNAFDYALGSTFATSGRIHMHIDYLWHMYDVIKSTEKFVLYYGPGLRVRTHRDGDGVLGVRGVMGASWFLQTAPMDIFAEIVPVLDITPDVNMSVNAGIGIRYFF